MSSSVHRGLAASARERIRAAARLAAAAPVALAGAGLAAAADVVAVQAGTVHTVAGEVIEGGGTVVVTDGKITAVGPTATVAVPPGARTVDYGEYAVIVPGLVAADSRYGSALASDRTADPGVRAIDNFDPFTTLHGAVTGGVTTLYMAPARNRLIAGRGAVVKSAGDAEARVLRAEGMLHGSISAEARRTPGYWVPRLPATVDVGLGVENPQLPRTTMGALVALDELLRLAGGDAALAEEYGAVTGENLREVLAARATWRMGAETAGEVRALLSFFKVRDLPLVIDGASFAKDVAEELAASGVRVIARPSYNGGADFGKGEDARWPDPGTVADLARAGVSIAIAAPNSLGSDDLLVAAAFAMRGGMTADVALRAITLGAAEALGVADRVGSLEVGKDGDLVVLNGAPLTAGTQPVATWIDGEEEWNAARDRERAAEYAAERAGRVPANAEVAPITVISVDELHLGDGHVLRPGEVLLRNGKVAEVGSRVGRPAGATVVRGAAAMPGMIDALGHLGLEGSPRPFSSRSDNTRILVPGDRVDRGVAQRGVTTVNLASRGLSGVMTPTVAYKPAAARFGGLVVDGAATVRMKWNEEIVADSGNAVRDALAKAKEYDEKWTEYEEALAKWKPPAEGEAPAASEEDEDEKSKGDAAAAEEGGDEAKDSDKKKKKGEREAARSVTGVWEGSAVATDGATPTVRLRLLESEDGSIEGTVRVSLYEELFEVSGSREGYTVELTAAGLENSYQLKLEQAFSTDPPPKKSDKKGEKKDESGDAPKSGEGGGSAAGAQEEKPAEKPDDKAAGKDSDKDAGVKVFLRGEVSLGGEVIATLDLTQVSTEYKIARRPEPVAAPKSEAREPKGKPKAPGTDPDLEVLRRAMKGEANVLVEVERLDQIVACVEAFADAGIEPVLVGAEGAEARADQLRGRIAGILPARQITRQISATRSTNRYAELAAAGLPIAFHSGAEEGAAELGSFAMNAVAQGLSPAAAIIALTSGAAEMLAIDDRVGTLRAGLDGDVVLLDGSPFAVSSIVLRTWINGVEVR